MIKFLPNIFLCPVPLCYVPCSLNFMLCSLTYVREPSSMNRGLKSEGYSLSLLPKLIKKPKLSTDLSNSPNKFLFCFVFFPLPDCFPSLNFYAGEENLHETKTLSCHSPA